MTSKIVIVTSFEIKEMVSLNFPTAQPIHIRWENKTGH